MKKRRLVYAITLIVSMGACAASAKKQAKAKPNVWKNYNAGTTLFGDKASETKSSDIYHRIIPDAESYIKERARIILVTLHNLPEDSIISVNKIHYTPEDIEGVSAKGGGNGDVTIFYSTRHIEKSFAEDDTARPLFETRGVLLHELIHAYRLEPQNVDSYETDRVLWAFIEGIVDAARVANGRFDGPNVRPRGGNYMDGYRTAGCFFVRLHDNKDPEFLRKFNCSTLEVIPWSFDGTTRHILGIEHSIDELWHKYQVTVGDIQV